MSNYFCRTFSFCLLSMLVAITTQAQPGSAGEDRRAMAASGQRWQEAFQAGDIAGLRALYEPDAWLMTHGAPVARGVDEIQSLLAALRSSAERIDFAVEPEDITIDGDYGFLVSKYWMRVTGQDGQVHDAAGRSLLIYKRGRDGIWRIWRDIDNTTPDVAADPDRNYDAGSLP